LWRHVVLLTVIVLGLSAAASASTANSPPFSLHSRDFRNNGPLPKSSAFSGVVGGKKITCEGGKNMAPTLGWSHPPQGTKSFALIETDLDAPVAGGFHHWIVYNIPGAASFLSARDANPYSVGTNDFGLIGYSGPCPPPGGEVHHYTFLLYALSVRHVAGKYLDYARLIKAIGSDVLGATTMVGTFVNNAPA
jgi:Raf kinase inhibitor-like YbhB/YbcL family protein